MDQPILEIDNIKVRYSGLPVLQGLSLQVMAGETVCVLGANGAGKSTLLRAVMGPQQAFEGCIRYQGREIQKRSTEEIVRLVQAVSGWNVTFDELLEVGERRLNMLRIFNAREGIQRKDDQLPAKFYQRPLAGGPTDGWKLNSSSTR